MIANTGINTEKTVTTAKDKKLRGVFELRTNIWGNWLIVSKTEVNYNREPLIQQKVWDCGGLQKMTSCIKDVFKCV